MQIIPSINCPALDNDCVTAKIRKAQEFASWAHVDVADGRFTFHKSWNDPRQWKQLNSKLNLEVHLMVEEPEKEIESWIQAGAKRIIVHLEAILDTHFRSSVYDAEKNITFILETCKKAGVEVMLAINSETDTDELVPYLDRFSFYQILAVHPGPAGQSFLAVVLPKIKKLRVLKPKASIEVDGGIIPETAAWAKEAGADILIAGSYTLCSDDSKKSYEELVNI